MEARAIVEGWDTPVKDRPAIVGRLVQIVKEGDSPREAIGAANSLISIVGRQIDAARLKIEQEKWAREKDGGAIDLQKMLESEGEFDAAGGSVHPDEVPG